jgi:hypothetical protein
MGEFNVLAFNHTAFTVQGLSRSSSGQQGRKGGQQKERSSPGRRAR